MSRETDELRTALGAYADGRRTAPGEHPDLEEILAYDEGRFDPARRQAIRDHLVLCPECTARLLDYRDFAGEEPAGGSSVAAAWERRRGTVWDGVQRRIGAVDGAPDEPAPGHAGHPVVRFLATAALAAACAVLSVLLWQAREEVERRHPVTFVSLEPSGSSLLRGGAPPDRIVVRPPPGHRVVLVLAFPDVDRYPRYAAEVLPPRGEGPGEVVEITSRSDDSLGVDLGIDPPPGQYRVLLHAVEEDRTRPVASYGFRVGLPEGERPEG